MIVLSILKFFCKVYQRELEADLKNEQGGDLGRIFRSIASGGRAENHGFEPDMVKKEAQNLYDVSFLIYLK